MSFWTDCRHLKYYIFIYSRWPYVILNFTITCSYLLWINIKLRIFEAVNQRLQCFPISKLQSSSVMLLFVAEIKEEAICCASSYIICLTTFTIPVTHAICPTVVRLHIYMFIASKFGPEEGKLFFFFNFVKCVTKLFTVVDITTFIIISSTD